MGSGPVALARCSIRDGAVVPHWLTERDHPWIRTLIEEYSAFVGEPRRRLDEHLARIRGQGFHTDAGWRIAVDVLDKAFPASMASTIPPPKAREAVFRAASGRAPRADVLERVARDLKVDAEALERALIADLPGERIVAAPPAPLRASSVALRCNLVIAQAALKHSSRVTIALEGNARAVVRHAKLRGLICTVSQSAAPVEATLDVSGPLALFRRTALYGRHLAELIPLLLWSRTFTLRAECRLRGQPAHLTLTPHDPLPPSAEPRLHDSLLERRFARDFTRAAAGWRLVREPEPIPAEGTLIFPDFALVHRLDPRRRWLLEIAGFWTSDYVETKLRRLRAARAPNLILCLDAARDCGEHRLHVNRPVIRYRNRIDIDEVMRLIEG